MERALVFRAGGEELLGVLHPGAPQASRGVLVVVGGPQYRVGSHRQFLLLARHLAAHGVPVLRFDYRGMGDSSGPLRNFEQIDDDIASAIDVFQAERPAVRKVVIWGLCDAASAALLYAFRDPRVTGLVLLNPWVRTEEGLAKAYLKHYYLRRLISRDFWSGVLRGRFNPVASLRSLADMMCRVARKRHASTGLERKSPLPPLFQRGGDADPEVTPKSTLLSRAALPERMAEGWKRFRGSILLILSGDDLTAAEFRNTAAESPAWRGLLDESRVLVRELSDANHTFSRREWRDRVAQWTLAFVRER